LTGVAVAVGVLLLATALGLWWQRRDGQLRPVASAPVASAPVAGEPVVGEPAAAGDTLTAGAVGTAVDPRTGSDPVGAGGSVSPGLATAGLAAPGLAALGVVAGTPVTLLQFSSAFCAPCRTTRRICAEVASSLQGVTHLEVDAESHLDEVRALDIWRTPTVLIVDATGRILHRATGTPSKAQVLATIGPMLPAGAGAR
jgi:thiol-disulfide isomerase/thioredoxin